MPGTVRCVGALLLGLGLVVAAAGPPADAAEASGTITKIDPKTRMVTAHDERTKQTFQFKVLENKRLRGLKVGQEVFADFKAMKVSLRPDDLPCCNIVTVSSVSTAPAPCCSIAAVDAVAGMATGIEKATGRRFQFKVADWNTLTGLKIGQPIHANFKTMKVSLRSDGATPCCDIVRR
jgi:Cu/Ag efflux protein CusF